MNVPQANNSLPVSPHFIAAAQARSGLAATLPSVFSALVIECSGGMAA